MTHLSKRPLLILIVFLFAGWTAACDDSSNPESDTGHDATTFDDVDDIDTGDELPTECTVTLELSDGLILAKTWPTPIEANSRPLICWTLPEGAAPAVQDGWDLVVEREETASGELETAEWYATGVPAETRQIHYASCDQAADCSTAADLAAGNYFIHILEANQPTGYAASLVITVE